jgi:hypothetical protein
MNALKGQVVGNEPSLKHTKLTRYEYQWPRTLNAPPVVKAVETGGDGKLTSLPSRQAITRRE